MKPRKKIRVVADCQEPKVKLKFVCALYNMWVHYSLLSGLRVLCATGPGSGRSTVNAL